MALTVFGLNHNSAPLEVLEKTVIEQARLPAALTDFNAALGDGVILSTCNRCEIYSVPQGSEDETAVADWLCAYCEIPKNKLNGHCFTYHGKDAVRHLIRVASSVDSMIVGEPQILGQVKSAYRAALDTKFPGTILSRLFESSISIAKQVRSETGLGKHPVSYVSAAVKACRRLFENLSDKRLLLLGTGEMIELAAQHFKSQGIAAITVAGRSPDKTRALAAEIGAQPLDLGTLNGALHLYDIVVSCTASPAPIVHKTAVAAALKQRKHKPMCMVDMALPRDMEATIEDLPDVYLYTLERLAGIVDDNKQLRLAAAAQAETLIRRKADEYAEWADTRKAADLIAQLLAQADDVRTDALEKSLKMLRSGQAPEEALSQLSTALTGKLMHPALETLKQAAAQGRFELLDAVARRLEAAGKPGRPK